MRGGVEIHPRDRICVVFDGRVHKARIDAIKRRSRMDPALHDVIEFRTVQDDGHEQVGTVPLVDRGLKWDQSWDAETMTALLAANALASIWEPTVLLDSEFGRPTWVL